MKEIKQPWIYSFIVDGIFILMPPFISILIIFLFPSYFSNSAELSVYAWFILILLIDVAHVYSTLYRTYFDKKIFDSQRSLFLYTPLFAWILSVILYEFNALYFWRFIAYLAVFHFIRQQYGFMRIYSRKENQLKWFSIIDKMAIYSATIYPILHWHLNSPRNFNWFVVGDFYLFKSELLSKIIFYLYLLIILLYIIKEIIIVLHNQQMNLPKNLIIIGTYLTWYLGIIYFNGDLIFTLLNVVSHGIPYMALVWISSRKKNLDRSNENASPKNVNIYYGIIGFVFVIVAFAYLEEGIWDAMIWKEHKEIFSFFEFLPTISDKNLLAIFIPLLSVPQLTHYILDGFIWRKSKENIV